MAIISIKGVAGSSYQGLSPICSEVGLPVLSLGSCLRRQEVCGMFSFLPHHGSVLAPGPFRGIRETQNVL